MNNPPETPYYNFVVSLKQKSTEELELIILDMSIHDSVVALVRKIIYDRVTLDGYL